MKQTLKMQRHDQRQDGFTLIEFLAVLAGIATLVGIIFGVLAAMGGRVGASGGTQSLASLVDGISQHHQSQSSFQGLTSQSIIDGGVVPAHMVNTANNGVVYNGQPVGFNVIDFGAGTSNAYEMTVSLASNACATTVGNLLLKAAEIEVNAVTVKDAGTPRPTPAAISAECVTADPAALMFTIVKQS